MFLPDFLYSQIGISILNKQIFSRIAEKIVFQKSSHVYNKKKFHLKLMKHLKVEYKIMSEKNGTVSLLQPTNV